ncbi:MAG: OmpA family protein [Gemmatimonadetes bacterium]|nr:OmpA family protein [Gemmatimonadota bacterium]
MGFLSRSIRVGFLCGIAPAGLYAGGCASTHTEQARAEAKRRIKGRMEVGERLRQAWAISWARESREFIPIFFDYDQYRIREDQKAALYKLAARLKANLEFKPLIEGHCDTRGTDRFNVGLGQRRADSARDFLIKAGVYPAQLTTASFGSERPVAPGKNESAWAKNRRVVFVWVEPQTLDSPR